MAAGWIQLSCSLRSQSAIFACVVSRFHHNSVTLNLEMHQGIRARAQEADGKILCTATSPTHSRVADLWGACTPLTHSLAVWRCHSHTHNFMFLYAWCKCLVGGELSLQEVLVKLVRTTHTVAQRFTLYNPDHNSSH